MAETIRGINVVIGAETTGLSKALSDVNKKSRDIQSELKQVEKLLKLDPTNAELVAQKQKLLGDAVATTKEKLDRLRAAQEQVNQQFQRGEISEAQYRAFQREIAGTEQALRSFEGRLDQTRQTTSKLGDALKDASEKIKNVGANIAALGASLVAGLGFAVKGAMDFDAQMSKVQALSGSTKEQFEELRQQAIDLGSSTSFSASQAAEGMQMLAAAGMNANQIMGAMPGILSAAAASGEDMSLVAETIGTALNTFSLEASQASHIADVLAVAANSSAIGIQDMAYMFKYAAPVAAQLGISLEELGAAAIEMGNAGIMGEQAGTTLRAALLRLVDPPKEAKETLNQLGVAITDSSGKMLPMSDIIGQLKTQTEGMTESQKAAALATIFGTEAVSGMMVVIDSGKTKFDQYTQALKNSNGAAAETAKVMQDNLKGSIDQLKGAFESATISIGSALAPAIKAVADFIGGLIDKFNALPGPLKEAIATFGAVAAVITTVIGAATVLGPILAALTGPVGLVVLAISGLVAAGVTLYRHWDEIKEKLADIWNGIKDTASKAWNSIKDFFKKWGDEIMLLAVGPAGWAVLLAQKLGVNWNTIKSTAENIWNTLHNSLSGIWSSIRSTAASVWDGIKNAILSPIEDAKRRILGIIDSIKSAFLNMRITIPKPKLPHISVSTAYKSVGGIKIPYPDFDINWYARGGIFTSPSIIGVGEAGKEAVIPLDRLPGLISDALSEAMPAQTVSGGNIVVQNMIVRSDSDIQKIARELFTLQQRAARARGM